MRPHRSWPALLGVALLVNAPASTAESTAGSKLGTRTEGENRAIHRPVLDDRSYGSLRGELVEEGAGRIPVHTPEWTNPAASDPGASALDPATGPVRFGDGTTGRRPPAGKNPVAGQYRTGGGGEPAAAAPAAVRKPAATRSAVPAAEHDLRPEAKRGLRK